jgi:hypothetical protein
MAITPVLDELARDRSWRGVQATQVTTAPVIGYVSSGAFSLGEDALAFNQAVLTFIAECRVRDVVIAARWARYPNVESLRTNLVATVRAVRATGARVWVVRDVPDPGFDVPRVAALTAARRGDLEVLGVTRHEHERRRGPLEPMFDEVTRAGAAVLDPAGYFLNARGLYAAVRDGQVLYWDSHHLSVAGSRLLAPLFEPVFQGD